MSRSIAEVTKELQDILVSTVNYPAPEGIPNMGERIAYARAMYAMISEYSMCMTSQIPEIPMHTYSTITKYHKKRKSKDYTESFVQTVSVFPEQYNISIFEHMINNGYEYAEVFYIESCTNVEIYYKNGKFKLEVYNEFA